MLTCTMISSRVASHAGPTALAHLVWSGACVAKPRRTCPPPAMDDAARGPARQLYHAFDLVGPALPQTARCRRPDALDSEDPERSTWAEVYSPVAAAHRNTVWRVELTSGYVGGDVGRDNAVVGGRRRP